MKLIFKTVILTISCIFILDRVSFAASASVSAHPDRKLFPNGVKKANALYYQGNYDEALKYYNEAEVDMPDSDVVSFNKGAALYQKGNYERAIEAFSKALLSDNPDIEEKAAYNIGNSKFRFGKLKENTDLTLAASYYREALDYYKRAIELNQKDTNAKYNHEFVEKELKVLLDKLKQQQGKSQQGSQQKQNQEQKQQKQVQSGASGEEQEQKQQTAAQGEEEKEGQQGEQAQKQAKTYESEQEAQEEMSEEEARIILDRYDQQDQSIGNMNRGARNRRYPRVLKDW